jgi:hypothetical protein
MIDKAQNFVFKAMLLNTELDTLREMGALITEAPSLANIPSEDRKETVSIDEFPVPIRLNAIKMSAVYMAFFAFENSVRALIKERLGSTGVDWWSRLVPKGVRDKVLGRQKKDGENKWHAPRAIDEIAYTDFGDMANIMVANWENFEDVFPSQDWIKTRLSDLEQSRNALAHNNVLGDRDIGRIKMYLEDWLTQVGG